MMNRKIVEYKIVTNISSQDLGEFAFAVNDSVNDGWQPFGDLYNHPSATFCYQVMVKYKKRWYEH